MKKLNEFELAEIATPAGNPDTGYDFLYFKSDGLLYSKNDVGVEAVKSNLNWYIITDYGADPTGSADSTTSIQAAIDAAEITGGIVYIPRGIYKVTATLNIDSNNVVIMGEGEASKIFASGNYGHIFDVSNGTPSDQYGGMHGIQFRNLYIDSETEMTSGAAIYALYSYNLIVQDVRIGTFDFAGDNSVDVNIYDGIRLQYQSAAIITGCQIYISHYGVYFSGNRIGAGAIGNFYWDGLITGNCNIWGKRNNGSFVTGSAGVYIDGGTGGIQIEQAAIGFFDNGIRVDDAEGQNRELFLGHSFAADDCGSHGIYVTGFLNVFQMTGGWSSSCGKNPVGGDDGYCIYIDDSVYNGIKVNITGGTFLNSNNGIYIGTGYASLVGVNCSSNLLSGIVLGPNVQDATISGGYNNYPITNNSAISPLIRGVIGSNDSGGNIATVTVNNVASGELSSGTIIDSYSPDKSLILYPSSSTPGSTAKVQLAVYTAGYWRSKVEMQNGSETLWLLKGNIGNVSIGGVTPTARLHLPAQNNSAGTAPLKFTSGAVMDTPEDGAIEYNGTHYYATVGATRYQLDQQSGLTIGGSNTQIQFNNSGSLGGSSGLTWDGTSVYVAGNAVQSTLRVGTLEVQNFSLNNSWIGDNVYYNGSFVARATGASTLFYFAGSEGQFRHSTSVSTGSSFTQIIPFKGNADGTVSLGGNAAAVPGDYSGGTALINSNGMSIGKNGSAPVASALIEMTSTSKGFLPPRMTAAQAGAISSPAEGLLVYVTDTDGTFTTKGWWGWSGAAWERLNN